MSDDTNKFTKGAPLPASLGRCVDLYKEVRDVRLAMDKEVEAVKSRENEIKEHLIANLTKEDSGAAGLRYRAQRVEKTVYVVRDWPAFWAMVLESGRTDFLQKRISDKAVADYVEQEQELLPGTERLIVPDVSITKI